MATNKYRMESPYIRPYLPPPEEDTFYHRHMEIASFRGVDLKVFGVAIFGIGRAGTIHITNLVGNRRTRILYIVDDDVKKLERIRNYYKDCLEKTVFLSSKDQERVLKDSNVDYIVCASPTITHASIVAGALNNKKAVFCEKPIAGSIEESKALYDLSEKVKKPLLSAFNRRFDDSYDAIKIKVRSGYIGKVLTVKVCSRDSPLPTLDYLRTSGGIFHDCSVHDIDQVISILGEYPSSVSVFAKANLPEIAAINDVDTVSITLSFNSGAIGMIDLSRQCVYGYDQRLEVFGEKGMLKAENTCPMQNLEEYTPQFTKKSPIFYSFASRYQKSYARELELFMDVLEGKDTLMVTGKELLAVSKIATACEESHKTGKIVSLKWSKEEIP